MRLHQTWVALSPVKKTVMLSARPTNFTLPPMPGACGEVTLFKAGSNDTTDADSVWFAISQEKTSID